MSEIILYQNKSDRKQLTKDLSLIVDITETFRLKEPTSVTNPVVTLSKTTVGKNWANVNYAYIPMFGRYYFIDKPGTLNDGLVTYEMTVDPLMTYRGNLLNTAFEIARSESVNSKYYIDPEKAIIQRRVVEYLPAKSGGASAGVPQSASNTTKYFITVAGG